MTNEQPLTVTELSRRGITLMVGEDDSPEEALDKWQTISLLKSLVTELKGDIEQSLVQWIADHGDITIPGLPRYYARYEKRTRCTNQRIALEAILDSIDGDFDRFAESLVSNAIKIGHAKEILGDDYDDLFITENKPRMREGKPVKTVHSALINKQEQNHDADTDGNGNGNSGESASIDTG